MVPTFENVLADGNRERSSSMIDDKLIFGAHTIIYSQNAEADRTFLRDVLGLSSVDAGDGWLIFAFTPR